MRRMTMLLATIALLGAACGDDGGGGGQAQTEEGAIEAVTSATEGALRGDVGAVLDFLSAECREAIDTDDVRLAVGLLPAFFNDLFDDFDVGDIEVDASIVSYDGDTARVRATYVAPDGTDIDTLGFSTETLTVEYEDGKWVDTGCEFEDTAARDAERLDEALAELGYAATREDPIPRSVAAPVGEGFVVAIDEIDTDAAAAIEAMGGFVTEPEPGEQFILVAMTVGFEGPGEPQSLTAITTELIGASSGTGFDSFGCGSFPTQLTSRNVKLFTGGVVTGDVCFVVPADELPGLLAVQGGFSDRKLVFDPLDTTADPVPVAGESGPVPDAEYTAARNSPTPLGEPVDLGEGWTITIRGFEDATAEIVAASEFNDPPPGGTVYGLLDYELAYDGDEQSSSAFSVDVDLVGDSNVTADENCAVSDVPNEIDRFTDVFQGGSLSGNQCFVVDAADLDSLVVLASASFFGEDALVLAVR